MPQPCTSLLAFHETGPTQHNHQAFLLSYALRAAKATVDALSQDFAPTH